MVPIAADEPWSPVSVEDDYLNTSCLLGCAPENSESSVYDQRPTVHRPSSSFNNGPLDCAHLYSSNRCYPSSVHGLGCPFPPEPWSRHPAIQSSTALFTNRNAQTSYYQDGISGMSSWPPSGRADACLLSGPAVTEPAGHQWKSNNIPSAERWYDFQPGIESQNEPLSGFNGSAKVSESSYGTPLSDLDRSSFTNDVCAIYRTGYHTSDNLASSLYHTVENGLTHHQNALDEEHHQEISTEHLSGISLGCHHRHRVSAHARESPAHPRSSPPKEPMLATSSTFSSIPACAPGPVAESWKCSVCGRVLATKGTKNRNRNKRRHHCPGTGPKYPCDICAKVFNRDDTRLLHLRKQHPEINVEPPQPRKRKTL